MRAGPTVRRGASLAPVWLAALAVVAPHARGAAQSQEDWEAAWDAEDERYDGLGDPEGQEDRPRRERKTKKRAPEDDGFYDDEPDGDADPDAGDDLEEEEDDDPFEASSAAKRGGLYLQVGAGVGYYSGTGAEPLGDITLGGMTFPIELRGGLTVADLIVVGGGLNVDFAPSPTITHDGMELELGDVIQLVMGLDLFALYYIDVDMGLSVQARLGWGRIETSADGDLDASDPAGFQGGLGVGQDFWLGGSMGVGLLLRASYGAFSLGSTTYGTISAGLLGTVTWY